MLNASEKIKVLMAREDFNQNELAKRLEIHESTLSYRLKHNKWTIEDLEVAAKALGCGVEVVFTTADGSKF